MKQIILKKDQLLREWLHICGNRWKPAMRRESAANKFQLIHVITPKRNNLHTASLETITKVRSRKETKMHFWGKSQRKGK